MVSRLRVNELEHLSSGRRIGVDKLLSRPYTIAVLGDSLSTENTVHRISWPAKLEQYLNQSGIEVKVHNFSVNGITFNRVRTELNHGTQTSVQALIDTKPDLVILSLGFNDTANRAEDRTTTQVQNDFDLVADEIIAGVPDASIAYAGVVSHDKNNGNVSALTNRNVIPFFYNRPTTGLYADAYSHAALGDGIGTTRQVGYDRWSTVTSYIKNSSKVDHSFDIDIWRIGRLGLLGSDGLHPRTIGVGYITGYAVKGLESFGGIFSNLGDKLYPEWNDPDTSFDNFLSWTGSDYDIQFAPGVEHLHQLDSQIRASDVKSWFMPSKARFLIDTSINAFDSFVVIVIGARPWVSVEVADTSSSSFTGTVGQTDTNGDMINSVTNAIAAGSYNYVYKVGSEIYGPFDITVEDSGLPLSAGGTGATSAANARQNLGFSFEKRSLPSMTNGFNEHTEYHGDNFYTIDSNGVVNFQFAVDADAASAQEAFTLPSDARPDGAVTMPCRADGELNYVSVNPDGTVNFPDYANYNIIFCDGVSFIRGGGP